MPLIRAVLLILLPLTASILSAAVRLPKLFSSHMVIQRDEPIHIWGWSDTGEAVTVTLAGTTVTTTASTTGDDLGEWSVYLPVRSTGEPLQLTVKGSNSLVLEDILMGDVWFASGQSNMEMPLEGFPDSAVVKNAAEEIRSANVPTMRLFLVKKKASDFPLNDFADEASWEVCSPETAAKFSAVAYFFGRDLTAREHVPIGLIDSTWGGTPAESWVSLDSLSSNAALMPVFAARGKMIDKQADNLLRLEAEQRADAAARAANQPLPKHSWHPEPSSWAPAGLFNGMVAPAVPFAIKGVIWYQGESNSEAVRAPLYQAVFSELITDWRQQWREGPFPFLFVQIANYKAEGGETWPLVREAQRRTLALVNTAMTVTIDIGEPDNIHPSNKQDVGSRLALGARALAYGEKLEFSGPSFRRTSVEKDAARVWFTHAGTQLVPKAGSLQGFEIAGEDRLFVAAQASIDGATVLVRSPQVAKPKYVRFGWANAPVVNLYNSAGLPASPFTSEDEMPPVPSARH